jgi:hypothetical protein
MLLVVSFDAQNSKTLKSIKVYFFLWLSVLLVSYLRNITKFKAMKVSSVFSFNSLR